MILTKDQEQGLKTALARYKEGAPFVTISGYAGTGKAQPVDTIIPTPEGEKRLGDIKVGDWVFDNNGIPTKVLGVYPQGTIDNYKLTFSDGRSAYCGIDHLWTCNRKGKVFTISVREMLEKGVKNYTAFNDHTSYNFSIPCITVPVRYNPLKPLDMSPYAAGVLLGLMNTSTYDEEKQTITYLTNGRSIVIEQMKDIIAEVLDAECIKDTYRKTSFYFKLKDFDSKSDAYKQDFLTIIKEKKLPENYVFSNASDRFEILQGFFDIAARVNPGRGATFFVVRNAATKEQDFFYRQILKILYSLSYVGSYIKVENAANPGMHLSIYRSDRPWQRLLKNSPYRDRAVEIDKKRPFAFYRQASIKTIEKMPEPVEMVCIYVDNYEHLYLTENFVVTHNTTLVKTLVQSLPGINPDTDVCYSAYTGKACQVLAKMGNKNTCTLHRLLFDYRPKITGGFIRIPRPRLDYPVVVVDECSMLSQEFVNMLLSYPDVFVIFLGDPFQLPPIKKDEGNYLLDNPHVFLSEIMRQEKDNDIVDLTMRIRANEYIKPQDGENVKVFTKKELNTGMLEWADIIICATNATRNKINRQMRELRGYGQQPCEGEKVICLQNNWDRFSIENTEPLVNGLVGYLSNVYTSFNPIPSFFNYSEPSIQTVVGNFVSETGENYGQITMDKKQFDKAEESLDWKTKFKLGKSKYKSLIPEQFTYGYAITAHRAQGSQWEKVLVIEENFPFESEIHFRWLYTSCTRASQKLVVINNR